MKPELIEALQSNLRRAKIAVQDMQEMIDLMRDAKKDVIDLERRLNENRKLVANWENALQKRGYTI